MALQAGGLIRNWGVSNFDVGDMQGLLSLPGGNEVQTDQVLYNLSRRAPEFELIPLCQELNIPIMAYSPIEQGRLLGSPVLRDIAARHDASPVQIALAWVLRQDGVCAIPRASRPEHVDENRAALDVELDRDDLAALDAEFPHPFTRSRSRCSDGQNFSNGLPGVPASGRGLRDQAMPAGMRGR